MRILLWLPLLATALPKGDEPELPPIKKVTLKLENIPAIEAASRFSRAAGCTMEFYRGCRGWGVDKDDLAKAMDLDLKEVPFFDALERFCLAHGNLSYTVGERMGIQFHAVPMVVSNNPQQGRFLFWTRGVEEEVQSDFTKSVRRCTVEMELCWQPDLRVLGVGSAVVTSVVDDRGRELIEGTVAEPEREVFKDWNERGPLDRSLVLPLAPREARSISIRGRIALQVPRRTVFVELPFHGEIRAIRAAGIAFEPSREGSGEGKKWRWVARAERGKLAPEQFLDLRNGCESDREYWSGWGKGGAIRGLPDGSVELVATGRDEDDACLRFTWIEGCSVQKVPFELKNVKLPR